MFCLLSAWHVMFVTKDYEFWAFVSCLNYQEGFRIRKMSVTCHSHEGKYDKMLSMKEDFLVKHYFVWHERSQTETYYFPVCVLFVNCLQHQQL
jgi:hypothetical protein